MGVGKKKHRKLQSVYGAKNLTKPILRDTK